MIIFVWGPTPAKADLESGHQHMHMFEMHLKLTILCTQKTNFCYLKAYGMHTIYKQTVTKIKIHDKVVYTNVQHSTIV